MAPKAICLVFTAHPPWLAADPARPDARTVASANAVGVSGLGDRLLGSLREAGVSCRAWMNRRPTPRFSSASSARRSLPSVKPWPRPTGRTPDRFAKLRELLCALAPLLLAASYIYPTSVFAEVSILETQQLKEPPGNDHRPEHHLRRHRLHRCCRHAGLPRARRASQRTQPHAA